MGKIAVLDRQRIKDIEDAIDGVKQAMSGKKISRALVLFESEDTVTGYVLGESDMGYVGLLDVFKDSVKDRVRGTYDP